MSLQKYFFTGVWQWVLVLIPAGIFYLLGGNTLLALDENPALRLVVWAVLFIGGFIISGWGARGAVARVR
jgi:hypothetical protein